MSLALYTCDFESNSSEDLPGLKATDCDLNPTSSNLSAQSERFTPPKSVGALFTTS